MTIKFNSKELASDLSIVASIVNPKNVLPILANVNIKSVTDNNTTHLMLTASDNESWLSLKAHCIYADDNVDFCVDAKDFLQQCRTLGDKMISAEIEGNSMTCKYDNGQFVLPIEDSQSFPQPLVDNNGEEITKNIDADKLYCAIKRTRFATSNDELRPVMNGVHFDFYADGMVSAASDGHKLVRYKDCRVTHNGVDTTLHSFTLPQTPCTILSNILSSNSETKLNVTFDDRKAFFTGDHFKLTTRLLEGRYPNYEAVIPKTNDKFVVIEKDAFVSALNHVLPMSNSTNTQVILNFTSNNVNVLADNVDFNRSANENVSCDYNNVDFKISFSGAQLLQMVQNIDGEKIKIGMKESSTAALLQEETQNENYEYTSLLMPMVIDN